ncbi:hypothetical protein MUB23_14335, partial [Cuneatibacter sp. NSJ-177]|uniref:hypothetical protein n=1 Tax=Cuneatibacter sp. NSJ-177 TaxID=2931401 RepID=UPI001FD2077B
MGDDQTIGLETETSPEALLETPETELETAQSVTLSLDATQVQTFCSSVEVLLVSLCILSALLFGGVLALVFSRYVRH